MRELGKKIMFLALLALCGCHSENCMQNLHTRVRVSFFHYQNPRDVVTLEGMSVRSVRADGSVVKEFIPAGNYSRMDLVLDPESDTSRFDITSNFLNERLVIVHSNTQEFVSAECGCRVKSYIMNAYVENSASRDSISIENPNVDEMYENENINMYLYIE